MVLVSSDEIGRPRTPAITESLSECAIVPVRLRRQRPMSRAATTSSARRSSAIDQPMTRRENTLRTTAP